MIRLDHPFLQDADLVWRDSLPVSNEFDDPYYSKDNGLEETRHVFLKGTELAPRLESHSNQSNFHILETGFGTGLNFLATLKLWRDTPTSKRPARLKFTSIESRPLRKDDIARALEPWKDELPGVEHLVANFPPRLAGHYRIDFGEVELTLLFDDIKVALEQLMAPTAYFDALYLDGFAPSRNPEMWTYPVLERLAALLKPGARVATFTAAGDVRRGLAHAGFDVKRIAGFGSKRDMTVATRNADGATPRRNREPWFTLPKLEMPQRVAVIGAGLAGAAAAHAIKDLDMAVTVFESGSRAAEQTSAVPHAGWHPHFSADFDLRSQLMLHGHLATLNVLDRLDVRVSNWIDECGVYFAADREDRVQRLSFIAEVLGHAGLDTRFVDAQTAEIETGVAVRSPGLISDVGGCINPRKLCETLLEGIDVRYDTEIDLLDAKTGWRVGSEDFDAVVLCTGGADSLSMSYGDFDIVRERGQVDIISSNQSLANQKRLLCFKGYVTRPGIDGLHVTGATVDDDGGDVEPTACAHTLNRDRLAGLLPDIKEDLDRGDPKGWVGWRRVSRDRMPVIGPVPNLQWYAQTYGPWTRGGAPGPAPQPKYTDGLYMSVGHGARGTSTAVISGEIIAAMLAGNPLPVPARLAHAIHPARFAIRKLKRKLTHQD